MGFDPRRWRPPPGSRPVTANLESLLEENEALRREVRALRLQLELAQARRGRQGPEMGWRSGGHGRVTEGSAQAISAALVERWGEAMARHPAWSALRIGPPGGLRGLIEDLRSSWWNPSLSLEQELDRHLPGLGAELQAALRGPHSRVRWAVRAAFALYGARAMEWLSEEPTRVVEELGRRLEQLERRQGGGHRPDGRRAAGRGEQQRRRGTRTANHSHAGEEGPRSGSRSGSQAEGAGRDAGARRQQSIDPRREALRLLGLESGASPEAIKRAYRRLAKAHHPDLGGDAEAFHRLDAAYRLLIA